MLHLDFLERARSLGHKGHWSDLNDAYALASLYKIKFKIVQVPSTRDLGIRHIEDVVGFRINGRRLGQPYVIKRVLVFFKTAFHIMVPVCLRFNQLFHFRVSIINTHLCIFFALHLGFVHLVFGI